MGTYFPLLFPGIKDNTTVQSMPVMPVSRNTEKCGSNIDERRAWKCMNCGRCNAYDNPFRPRGSLSTHLVGQSTERHRTLWLIDSIARDLGYCLIMLTYQKNSELVCEMNFHSNENIDSSMINSSAVLSLVEMIEKWEMTSSHGNSPQDVR